MSYPSSFDAPLMPCEDGLHNWQDVTTKLYALGQWVTYTDTYCMTCGLSSDELS